MHIEDEIRNLLEKEVEKKDVRIDSIKLEKEDNNLFLRIVIDSDEIIDVDKCVEVTNIINPLLDEKDLITGKDLKATEAIKEYVEKKCERLQKYTEDELDIKATIRTEGNTQVAEISTNINGNIYRAVSEQKDLYASIDKDIDIVEGQIRKMKTKKEKQMTSESIKDYEIISFNEDSHQVEKEVLKTQYYEVRPMSVEDAKLKLQDSKNMFLTFVNADTEEVNVIFKLKDGVNFGLVEPE